MASEWENQVQKLRSEAAELQRTLDQTDNLTADQKNILKQGATQIGSLSSMSEDTKGLLGDLPKILRALFSNGNLGVAVIGQDGEWLLYNSTIRSIFGVDPDRGNICALDTVQFLTLDKQSMAAEDLPWNQALHGEDIQESEIIFAKPNNGGDIWLQVAATPLLDAHNHPSGAVVIIADRTELVQIAKRVEQLESQLQNQLALVESAESTVRQLCQRLGTAAGESPPASPALKPVPESKPAESQILVVDDIPVNQRLLLLQLKKLGYSADTANNGREAFDLCRTRRYALVLMDCDMPVMDGYEATRTIRNCEAGTGKYTPIVAMTSLDRESDRERCLAAGMDDYLTKGVDEKSFRLILDKYLPSTKDASKPKPAIPLEQPTASNSQSEDFSVQKLTDAFSSQELEDIVTLFMGSSSTLLSCMDFAIDDKDLKGLGHFAYSLKGPASTMSMHSVSRLCTEITTVAERGDWDSARKRHRLLRCELATVQDKLQQFVKTEVLTNFTSRT